MNLSANILNKYNAVDEAAVDAQLGGLIRANDKKWIVLDDDPTGVQTVHDVSVYTDWSYESICKGLREENRLFYILTNSRGLTREQTTAVHEEIARNILRAARDCGKDFLLISRSDSTLRGHYPLETEVLRGVLEAGQGQPMDGEILCPFFPEGGRYTIDNVHYVKYGDTLVPASETEFARDKTFGYKSSDMRAYVEEKTCGVHKAENVMTISLEALRAMDVAAIEQQLMQVNGFDKIVVNAVSYVDLKIFAIALYGAMARGKRFMFRTAAGFVKVVGGVTDRPLLTRDEMVHSQNHHGGLIIVGSHTEKTTAQLEQLKRIPGLKLVAFDSDLVLYGEALEGEVQRVLTEEESAICAGRTVVVYTNRQVLSLENDTKEEALIRSVKISDAVWRLVGELQIAPGFIVAKGGITSSDIGVKALRVKRADVLGQISPGIPVWQTGPESRFPGIPYVIFPGNVGDEDTLRNVVNVFMAESGRKES